jgi:hypothetical protein
LKLLRAWSWVDRVESLHTSDGMFDLKNCGISQLLMVDRIGGESLAADAGHF